MSKVFEALLRRQQQEQDGGAARDPLAEETGTPDASGGDTPFELPSVIGAPIGPRSNEGALFPSFNPAQATEPAANSQTNGKTHHPPQHPPQHSPQHPPQHPPQPAVLTPVNGKHKTEHKTEPARPAAAVARGASERLRNAAPVIRRTEPEPPVQPQAASSATSSATVPDAAEAEIRNPKSEIRNPAKQQREIPVEPIAQSRLHPRLVLLTQPLAPECEQYRTLRTQLFHAAERKPLQVVTITSTLAGEGKTSTAINLALAIAQSKEKRVLIIDGDLRRPNVATYLGARAQTGVGEILTGDGQALDSIFTLEGFELYVLPVSREAANPTELLSSERFAEMLAELRRYFDFILIDSPPVMPFADTRLLANHSDAVMLVVRAGLAPYETVEKAIESLPAAKMLGVVLNGAQHGQEAGYYDYYYSQSRPHSFWGKLLHRLRSRRSGGKLNR